MISKGEKRGGFLNRRKYAAKSEVATQCNVENNGGFVSEEVDTSSAPLPRAPMYTSKMLRALIIPLIIEQLLAVTVGLADTFMVSSVGTEAVREAAVSGISLIDGVNMLIIAIMGAIGTGGVVVVAQYLGRGDEETARSTAKQLIYVMLITAILISVIVFSAARPIINGMFGSASTQVKENAYIYFMWSAASYPFLGVYNAGAALYRGMGNSRISMYVSLAMNVINVIGNAVFIYAIRITVAGVAISSLISRGVACLIVFILLFRPTKAVYLTDFKPSFNGKIIKKILFIALPNGVENSLFHVGKLIVAGLVATLGDSLIAANSITGTLANFCNVPGSAIGLALVTIAGTCCGANEQRQAQWYTVRLLALVFVLNAVLGGTLFLISPYVFTIFGMSAEATSAAIQVSQSFAIAFVIFWAFAFTLPCPLRAAGDVKFTMTASMISMLVFRVAAAYLFVLTFNLGLLGVWLAMYVDWIVRAICFTIRFLSGKWKKIDFLKSRT